MSLEQPAALCDDCRWRLPNKRDEPPPPPLPSVTDKLRQLQLEDKTPAGVAGATPPDNSKPQQGPVCCSRCSKPLQPLPVEPRMRSAAADGPADREALAQPETSENFKRFYDALDYLLELAGQPSEAMKPD